MELVLVALSTVLASLPLLFALGVVWFTSRFDREPLWLVVLSFFWGAVGAVFLALPLNTGLQMLMEWLPSEIPGLQPGFLQTVVGPMVGAPLFEEPSKAVFLLFVAWNRRPNSMSAGFVYGAAAGLGFAATENFLYFSSVTGDITQFVTTVGIRTIFCTLLHAMCTAVVGACFGFGRLRGWFIALVSTALGLCAAMVLHAVWNGMLSLDAFSPNDLRTLNFFLLPLEVLFVAVIWLLCLLEETLTIRRELQEEEDLGNLPRNHSWKLANWFLRVFGTFAPPGVDHGRYVQTATSLARRKHEQRLLGSRASAFYRDDVRRLRKQLKMFTASAS